ncbi:MAG TPA: MFS transporter [Caulobacteraceae bacterium]
MADFLPCDWREATLVGRLDLGDGPTPILVVGVMLSIFQQLVGINAVLYYAPMMFKNMGSSTDGALLQTVIVGAANVVFTIVAMATVESLGRKPLLIAGAVVMAMSMLALGGLFASHQMGLLSLIMVIVYIAGFPFSSGPIVWVMLAEIFTNSIKGQAMALAVQWLANLVVSWSFKVINGDSALNATFNHSLAYVFYGVMIIPAALFVWSLRAGDQGAQLGGHLGAVGPSAGSLAGGDGGRRGGTPLKPPGLVEA